MELGEVDVDFTADASGFAVEARVAGASLGTARLAREAGYSSTGGILALGEVSVVYVYAEFETSKPGKYVPHGPGPGLAHRIQTWAAIPLSAQPPVPFERNGGGRLTEDPADASRAMNMRCARGAVQTLADHELQRCDTRYRLVGPTGATLLEGFVDPASNIWVDVYMADLSGSGVFSPMPCVEIDGDSGDAIKCVGASGATIAEVSGNASRSFDFFAGPAPGADAGRAYLRVSSHGGDAPMAERLAFDGARFAPAATGR